MKEKENFESMENAYKNLLNEKNKIEKSISNYKLKIKELNNNILNYNNNYNEIRMFSPRQNQKEKEEYISEKTEEMELIQKQLGSYEKKLSEIEHYLNMVKKINEKSKIQIDADVLNVNENDKKRIARDLHDVTIQDLIYVMHKIEIASKFIDQDPIRAKLELSTIRKSIKNIIQDMRNIVFQLHPMTFDDLGFESSLSNFIDNISLTTEIKITCKCNISSEKYNNNVLINLFRIIQECCNNSLKHSKGSKLEINIYEKNNILYMFVQDDGIGFKLSELENNGLNHFGIKIIKERVSLLSGKCEILSDESGTKTKIEIPMDFS